jgi:hypothetical protein
MMRNYYLKYSAKTILSDHEKRIKYIMGEFDIHQTQKKAESLITREENLYNHRQSLLPMISIISNLITNIFQKIARRFIGMIGEFVINDEKQKDKFMLYKTAIFWYIMI